MRKYHKNPRKISDQQYGQLQSTLAELGDLSGIVHDLNSDEIIGGNQRSDVFDVNYCKIELTHEMDEPDEQGTVGQGYIQWQGKRYAYRQVRWTPEQCEKANIVANKAGGDWDFEELANSFDLDDLMAWGFDDIGEIAEAMDKTQLGEPSERLDFERGSQRKQIRPVLYVDDVSLFERAIQVTGERNRGKAIVMCSPR